MFGLDFIALLILLLSLAIVLVVTVPLTGALVRLRANFNPKGLQLDHEGSVQPHTGPIVTSYFGMLKRVYKIEGVSGLYKGFMPTLLSTVLITLFVIVFFDATTIARHDAYSAPPTGVLGTLAFATMYMLVSLPATIITYRAITTPHKLPWVNPMVSLRVLLTPTERRRPYILYLTPGLIAAQLAHIAYVTIVLQGSRRLLLPQLQSGEAFPTEDVSAWRIVLFVFMAALSTAALCPLEVITTRLAIQRNHASAEYNSVAQEVEGDAEETVEYAGAEEDVIGLRSERDPYLGLVDCAKRIIDEEGIRTLYRGWWITLLGGVGRPVA
ncbi:hypothetical protein PUNSTDRAFT_98399 [Punctularia strigosozonata HHB-11173 SS5]|uniref:uncharacterized protein n=1 Tax=Punctularia strigosozonata (strain HHB-11173) TaxID=741275 RepID=UPI000441777A|nr:uncharacterized protein PUNSTDRAFT_98399 [Punctularia strigosozonata HHB-11173 SS5]EIN11309.1 hypothetical protein PUNSTDRAFT_98399 [Punctularia strigosozonata HHB-11173 SS5]